MAGHTPGPWNLKQFGGAQISGQDGYAVATMWGAISVTDLAGADLANARLIAAAPELLEALKLALEYWSHRQQRYKNRHPVWVQEARHALAKATGEAA